MVKNNHGFSLIELVIVITIISILLGLAVPFGFKWAEEARLHHARTILIKGYQFTKSLALRSPTSTDELRIEDSIAARMFLRGEILVVCDGSVSMQDCIPNASVVRWHGQLPSGVTVKLSNSLSNSKLIFEGDTTPINFNHQGVTVINRAGKIDLKNGEIRYILEAGSSKYPESDSENNTL